MSLSNACDVVDVVVVGHIGLYWQYVTVIEQTNIFY